MTAVILPFPTRPRLLSRTVSCPVCQAAIGSPCVVRGTRQRRPEGPHTLRIELAEEQLERNKHA